MIHESQLDTFALNAIAAAGIAPCRTITCTKCNGSGTHRGFGPCYPCGGTGSRHYYDRAACAVALASAAWDRSRAAAAFAVGNGVRRELADRTARNAAMYWLVADAETGEATVQAFYDRRGRRSVRLARAAGAEA